MSVMVNDRGQGSPSNFGERMAGHNLSQNGSRTSITRFDGLGPAMMVVRGSEGSVGVDPVMFGGFPPRGSVVGLVLADLASSAAEPKC